MSESNNCYIASGTIIRGTITSNGDIRVDGVISGTVNTQGRLIVGEAGAVDGELVTNFAEIAGKMELKKIDSQSVRFTSTARFKGDIEVNSIEVEPGAQIEGHISMKK